MFRILCRLSGVAVVANLVSEREGSGGWWTTDGCGHETYTLPFTPPQVAISNRFLINCAIKEVIEFDAKVSVHIRQSDEVIQPCSKYLRLHTYDPGIPITKLTPAELHTI